jgi:hypothetical protein
MVKQQNFSIVNAHVILNLLVFFMSLLTMHKGQKFQQGTSQIEREKSLTLNYLLSSIRLILSSQLYLV